MDTHIGAASALVRPEHAGLIRNIHTRFSEGSIHNEMLPAIGILYRTKAYSRTDITTILVTIADSVRIRPNRQQEVEDTCIKFFEGEDNPDLWGLNRVIEQNCPATPRKSEKGLSIPPSTKTPATASPARSATRGCLIAPTISAAWAAESDSLLALYTSSPHIGIFRNTYSVRNLIKELYPDSEELLIVGMSKFQASVLSVKEVISLLPIQGQARFEFLVPNPAILSDGALNKMGKQSIRCLANIKERRYLVIEFDLEHPDGPKRTLDSCAALGIELAKHIQLAMCVYSAGKSLHFWFAVSRMPEIDIRRFFAYAVRLGADPATWTACQYIRFPEGRRDQNKTLSQTVIYYNPLALL